MSFVLEQTEGLMKRKDAEGVSHLSKFVKQCLELKDEFTNEPLFEDICVMKMKASVWLQGVERVRSAHAFEPHCARLELLWHICNLLESRPHRSTRQCFHGSGKSRELCSSSGAEF